VTTDAEEAVDHIETLAIVETRVGRAVVVIELAFDARKAGGALALEAVDPIPARGAVATVSTRAVVVVGFAREARESSGADALKAVS
jgi:hypothetical protein